MKKIDDIINAVWWIFWSFMLVFSSCGMYYALAVDPDMYAIHWLYVGLFFVFFFIGILLIVWLVHKGYGKRMRLKEVLIILVITVGIVPLLFVFINDNSRCNNDIPPIYRKAVVCSAHIEEEVKSGKWRHPRWLVVTAVVLRDGRREVTHFYPDYLVHERDTFLVPYRRGRFGKVYYSKEESWVAVNGNSGL